MQFHDLDDAAYAAMRDTVIKVLENPFLARGQQAELYGNIYDVLGNPTVGYGYDLTQHDMDAITQSLTKAFDGAGEDTMLAMALEKIGAWKAGSLSARDPCAWRPKTPLLDDARATRLLSEMVEAMYEPALDSALARRCPGVTVPRSRERAALVSLVFNGGPGMVGPGLGAALAAGNRAECWWQIRWASNGGNSAGIATRRAYEGTLFGLYDDPRAVPPAEAAQVDAMDKAHADRLKALNARFADAAASADRNYPELLGYLPEGRVPTLDDALAPAQATA
ncbi:hemolysin related protein [Caenispirillum salinarum AK4]|uniref:Lysozyme n=1 Tax=Caenispirillum salinarum AK4 TaxID=1238182 RepID=K9HTQ0_9PROT|nr:hemolysin related protein [Caenispirillum salinarum]EKV31626.1 hemolysin related protein [Caenispirillum salinarum AK4]